MKTTALEEFITELKVLSSASAVSRLEARIEVRFDTYVVVIIATRSQNPRKTILAENVCSLMLEAKNKLLKDYHNISNAFAVILSTERLSFEQKGVGSSNFHAIPPTNTAVSRITIHRLQWNG